MSLSDTRNAISGALADVESVHAFPVPPTVMTQGSAWPLLESLTAQGVPGLFEQTWRLLIVTGGTDLDGIAFLDSVLDNVIEALRPVAYVESVSAVVVATQSGNLPAVELALSL